MPSKLRFLLRLALALFVCFTLLRLAFLIRFSDLDASGKDTARAFYLGAKFDLRLVALLLTPVWLLFRRGTDGLSRLRSAVGSAVLAAALVTYSGLVLVAMVNHKAAVPWLLVFLGLSLAYGTGFRDHGTRACGARWLWGTFAATAALFVWLTYFLDFGTYGYIRTRLNGTLLMFLDNPDISLRMIRESYAAVPLVLLLAALVAASLWGIRALWRAEPDVRSQVRWLWRVLGSVVILATLWGKWSLYPLRWGEVFEARRAFDAHLALNPILFLLETRRDMDTGFDLESVRALHPVLADYFGIPPRSDADGNPSLLRDIPPRRAVPAGIRPNLVFIQVESFPAFKTGVFGNPLEPTPFFDSLCRDGVLFERFYVPMENTSRSMFATLFGIADVTNVQNATRNPLLVDQNTSLSALRGYRKLYFLGGSANWAQIRASLKNNIKDLEIFEEGSYLSPVVDVWGISDADLLLESSRHLDEIPSPFWALIQTAGNHPPFTIPSHIKTFVKRTVDADRLRAAGFVGNDEYNAYRLMDHSLELFFRQAEHRRWFRNTIFVIWGDHGVSRGSTDTRFGDLGLAVHHVPLLLYSPALLKPRRAPVIASSMDILPTVVAMLGLENRTQTLGKDLFDPRYGDLAAAFTFTTFRRPPRIGVLQGDYYVNVDPNGSVALFRTDETDPRDRSAQEPERAASMARLARAFHEWSKYLLAHNKPLDATP